MSQFLRMNYAAKALFYFLSCPLPGFLVVIISKVTLG
jgi:hypothetical protein